MTMVERMAELEQRMGALEDRTNAFESRLPKQIPVVEPVIAFGTFQAQLNDCFDRWERDTAYNIEDCRRDAQSILARARVATKGP